MHTSGKLDVRRDRRDRVSRLRFPTECIAADDANMSALLRHWMELRPLGLLPAPRSIDPLKLGAAIGRLHKVDTKARQPDGYYFRLWGSRITLDAGKNYTNVRVADYPSEAYAEATMQDYHDVVMSGVPSYQQVQATIDYMPYQYARLILPLADNGRDVTQLLVFVNERELENPLH